MPPSVKSEISSFGDRVGIGDPSFQSIFFYFFFAGKEEIFQHSIQLNAEYYTPVDGELIPTGEIHSVANTEFDLRVPKMMGDIIGSKIFIACSI